MSRVCLSVTTIRQLIKVRMMSCVGVQRNLACLHRAVGGVRWMSSDRPAPLLTAAPVRGLVDEPVSITGRFMPPNFPVTVRAQMHSEDGDLWEAFAHYNTNADGTVNLTRDQSVGGSYVGCEPMGLFWGLQPAPGEREGLRLRKKNVETPFVVQLSLLQGHVSSGEGQIAELASVTTERWYMAPGVRRIDIRQNGVVATLFLPPGPGPFPAMLDIWGMGGGLIEYRSALFASRGYASMSLAYFGHNDLPGPQTHINVGDPYFKSAFHLLQDHHQICADRVGIIGLSYGVYLTLRLAFQTGVKASCLVAVSGPIGGASISETNSSTESFLSDETLWTYDDKGYVSFRNVSLPANMLPEHKLKLENLACPLMFIVGEDDLNAAVTENAVVLEETLRAAGKSQLLTLLSYPGAGHLIEPPYAPNARSSLWSVKPVKRFTQWGGHPAPHAAAQEDSWRRILDFLDSNLRR